MFRNLHKGNSEAGSQCQGCQGSYTLKIVIVELLCQNTREGSLQYQGFGARESELGHGDESMA